MTREHLALWRALLLVCLMPVGAAAQPAPEPQEANAGEPSRLWLVAGGAFTTVRGDCRECEEETPYRHAGSVLASIGYSANRRMDVGAEVFWVPLSSGTTRIRTIHIDAVAQFRPWASKGFFVKGGAGMAFVRNWVDVVDSPITQKALSVVIGGGWAFRPAERVGLQVFATQHAAALGDLQTPGSDVADVMGNFWAVGAALVIR